jgi:hypothetical protein
MSGNTRDAHIASEILKRGAYLVSTAPTADNCARLTAVD